MKTETRKQKSGKVARLVAAKAKAVLTGEQIQRLFQDRANGSVHERAGRLCGVIKGGRRDVATSHEYLKQYGQKRAA